LHPVTHDRGESVGPALWHLEEAPERLSASEAEAATLDVGVAANLKEPGHDE